MAPFSHLPKHHLMSGSTLEASIDRTVSVSRLPFSGWWLWAIPTLLVSGGAAYWAVNHLLALPDMPGCRAAAEAKATTSVQLYCAQQIANRQTTDDLRRAILMVNEIAANDPFREEGDRWMRTWTETILGRGEAEFQAGNLQRAIRIAERIPTKVRTRPMATERIDRWQRIWSRAERIYDQTQTEIGWRNWSRAMNIARELLAIENQYWATTKHQELMNVLQATQDANKIQPSPTARRTPEQSTNPVGDYLTQRQREREQEATARLARARELASAGDVAGLQAAISEARQVLFGTPRYDEAQAAITTWRKQIEAIEDWPYLDRARTLASRGDLESLEAAIREARRIGWGRPLHTEAHQQIAIWQEQASQLRLTHQTPPSQTIEAVDVRTPSTEASPAATPVEEAIDTLEGEEIP
ncbi:hypothetical protein [Egbenema bharatensis]|uniref:hypothetical protein n=1 Tax=Egbenema bharatensis TaxID=3463334 RepID=UPI003A84D2EE